MFVSLIANLSEAETIGGHVGSGHLYAFPCGLAVFLQVSQAVYHQEDSVHNFLITIVTWNSCFC